jgi:pimeloyl-ACP methyl ester carboxylesterase
VPRRELLRGLAGAAIAVVPLIASSRLAVAAGPPPVPATDSPLVSAASTNLQEDPMTATTSFDATSKPTVVLVHGAFAESSSWDGIVDKRLAEDYPVVAVANPLRGVRRCRVEDDPVLVHLRGAR